MANELERTRLRDEVGFLRGRVAELEREGGKVAEAMLGVVERFTAAPVMPEPESAAVEPAFEFADWTDAYDPEPVDGPIYRPIVDGRAPDDASPNDMDDLALELGFDD